MSLRPLPAQLDTGASTPSIPRLELVLRAGRGRSLSTLLSALSIGCPSTSEPPSRRTRSQHQPSPQGGDDAPPPPLHSTERDSNGRVVYVDLHTPASTAAFDALRARLAAVQPSDDAIVRHGARINANRFLWTVIDATAIDLFSTFLTSAVKDPHVGGSLREMLAPLGGSIRLLGAHFICGRLSEETPVILPQQLHRDHAGAPGEVIAIGMHVEGLPMGTHVAASATDVDDPSPVIRAANSPVFAFDTHAVHRGPPGSAQPHRGPPRVIKNRVFWMLCSASLGVDSVAAHREANGFRGISEVVFDVGES